MRIHGVQP